MLNRRGVRKIVTYCPHCMNTLKNEYPQLGGRFEVLHYSEYFLQLLREKRFMIRRPLEGHITYQDPCYLGRVNGIYMAPRELVRMIPGLKLREMARSREHSFCCGGGGGGMWIHENIGRRINQVRSEEALEMDVDVVGTACPYCLTMFEDGLKNLEGEKRIRVLDLSEIIHRAIQ
jgi:Fe-S oxidoreductase